MVMIVPTIFWKSTLICNTITIIEIMRTTI